jgi:hypothetical protein
MFARLFPVTSIAVEVALRAESAVENDIPILSSYGVSWFCDPLTPDAGVVEFADGGEPELPDPLVVAL